MVMMGTKKNPHSMRWFQKSQLTVPWWQNAPKKSFRPKCVEKLTTWPLYIRLGQLLFKIFCFGCILSQRWVWFILIYIWQGIFWYTWRPIKKKQFLWPIYWLSKNLAWFSLFGIGLWTNSYNILDLDSCNHRILIHHQLPLWKPLKLGALTKLYSM
jgi:hypothetical protein